MNKTQCPHCFTVYQITEEQLLKSKGNVRCGSCHERFKANLLSDQDITTAKKPPVKTNDLFTEVRPDRSGKRSVDARAKKPIKEQRTEPKIEAHTDAEDDFELPDRFTHFVEEPSLEDLSEPNFDEFDSEQSIDFKFDKTSDNDEVDDDLLNEIDQIIDDKLVNHTPKPVKSINWTSETENDELEEEAEDPLFTYDAEGDESFDLDSDKGGRSAGFSFAKLLKSTLMLILIGLALLVLGYQVWIMPQTSVRNNAALQSTFSAIYDPIIKFADSFGYTIDRPNDLTGIKLVSAQSEPHPSRASTTLMRISFLNQSSVAQPLPWVELTLTNESGGVVARRALDPSDYLFNNAAIDEIGPNELKKITIELLAFPKQATGYEMRMLESAPI